MIISYDGKDWQFDREAITVDEWRELKRKYKMTPKGFQDGIAEADPDASTFLYWILLRQSGDQRAVLGDHLKPDVIALNEALSAEPGEEGEEDGAGPEADPTKAGASPAQSPPAPATPAPGAPAPWLAREGAALPTA
jgi:hypothetical protein